MDQNQVQSASGGSATPQEGGTGQGNDPLAVFPPLPEVIPGDKIYQNIMSQIDPELINVDPKILEEKYKDETEAQKKERFARYAKAFEEYEKQYQEYMQSMNKLHSTYKRLVMASFEEASRTSEDPDMSSLESKIINA